MERVGTRSVLIACSTYYLPPILQFFSGVPAIKKNAFHCVPT